MLVLLYIVLYGAVGFVVCTELAERINANAVDWPVLAMLTLWPIGLFCILVEWWHNTHTKDRTGPAMPEEDDDDDDDEKETWARRG